jgi:hypothetical protein
MGQKEKVYAATDSWTKLLCDELHHFYSCPNNIRIIEPRTMRWVSHEGDVNCVQKFGRKIGRDGPLGRLKRKWKDNIKM